MLRVFISSCSVDESPAASLISRLRVDGFEVDHSPSVSRDPRFANWYEEGLDPALANTNVFIAVVDESWDCSTWMAIEADRAQKMIGPNRCFFWNPNSRLVLAKGMLPYLKEELPKDLNALIDRIDKLASLGGLS